MGEENKPLVECPCGIHGPARGGCDPAYFLQISLRTQLTELLSVPNIAAELNYRFTITKQDEDAIEDVYDGEEYRKLCEPGQFLDNQYNFSLTFNTDGLSLSKSSHCSAWPVYVQINELAPHARKRHILLAGVWVDKLHPLGNVFLRPIVEELGELYHQGITWNPDNQTEVRSRFVTVICIVDSIARPLILRMNQFNGDYGCTLCYTQGHRKNGHKTYPVDENVRLRTDMEVRQHMNEAFETRQKVFGVQGISCLTILPQFDICNGIVVDSMHNVFLGVAKQHTEQLLSDPTAPWYVGDPNRISVVNECLLSIKPPSRISRRPRSILCRKEWKASE